MDYKEQVKLVPCVVCREPSTGLHYGVLSCEACKGFFRRNYSKRDLLRCMQVLTNITATNRNACKFCRMQKCIDVGMNMAAITRGRRMDINDEVRRHLDADIVECSSPSSSSGYSSDPNSPLPDTPSPADQSPASPSTTAEQELIIDCDPTEFLETFDALYYGSTLLPPVEVPDASSCDLTDLPESIDPLPPAVAPVVSDWDPLAILEGHISGFDHEDIMALGDETYQACMPKEGDALASFSAGKDPVAFKEGLEGLVPVAHTTAVLQSADGTHDFSFTDPWFT